MKTNSFAAVVILSLAGTALAIPSPQASGVALPACVSTCINQVVGTGECTDGTDVTCLCGSSALKTCVQKGCPPSFVDTLGQFCGTGPFSSSSSGTASFTIQTNTLSGATATSTASVASTSATTAAVSQSSHSSASVASTSSAAATTAASSGNAGNLAAGVPGLKAILATGLAFVAGALLA